MSTRDKGMVLQPDGLKDLEVVVDVDFASNWCKDNTDNPDTARLRHKYIISYAGSLVLWKSKLQQEILHLLWKASTPG